MPSELPQQSVAVAWVALTLLTRRSHALLVFRSYFGDRAAQSPVALPPCCDGDPCTVYMMPCYTACVPAASPCGGPHGGNFNLWHGTATTTAHGASAIIYPEAFEGTLTTPGVTSSLEATPVELGTGSPPFVESASTSSSPSFPDSSTSPVVGPFVEPVPPMALANTSWSLQAVPDQSTPNVEDLSALANAADAIFAMRGRTLSRRRMSIYTYIAEVAAALAAMSRNDSASQGSCTCADGTLGGIPLGGGCIKDGSDCLSNIENVTCPFLKTVLNTGDLEVKPVYRISELVAVAIDAGLSPSEVANHVNGNFRNVPTRMMDIFNMEGNPNEHKTSTGILDCPSNFPAEVGPEGSNCADDPVVGNKKCTSVGDCRVGNVTRMMTAFNLFYSAADEDADGFLTLDEIKAVAPKYNTKEGEFGAQSDINDGGHLNGEEVEIEGTIEGAFRSLIRVFGETCMQISRTRLQRVMIDAQYPEGYTFPSTRLCPEDPEEPEE